jgi:hypothetical protein
MEENKRLRNLVHASEKASSEPSEIPVIPAVSNDLYPSSAIGRAVSSLGEASWHVPTSREIEGVQVDGIIIQSLFEQYA